MILLFQGDGPQLGHQLVRRRVLEADSQCGTSTSSSLSFANDDVQLESPSTSHESLDLSLDNSPDLSLDNSSDEPDLPEFMPIVEDSTKETGICCNTLIA